jgi:predicted HAD superfamily Cof-like phosphohydrolase
MSDETKQCGTCGHAAHGNVGMGCTVEWESDGETFACGCAAAPEENPRREPPKQCEGWPDCGWHNGGPCKACKERLAEIGGIYIDAATITGNPPIASGPLYVWDVTSERDMVRAFHVATQQPVHYVPKMPGSAMRLERCRWVLEETLEFIEACGFSLAVDPATGRWNLVETHAPNLANMAQENADIRVLTHGNDLVMGAPPEVFAEVHRANMAKVDPDGQVLRREDGKILKPEGWQPPDVAGVLRKAGWKP